MSDCEWCHTRLSEEAERMVPPLLEQFGPRRQRYVEDTFGRMPAELCARDFLELYAQANLATFVEASGDAALV